MNIDSPEYPYDMHMNIALRILSLLHEHNQKYERATDRLKKMRYFEVRIGLNANVDNIVSDINGNKNIAGDGINMASRIMDKADGSQILVGGSIYEVLCQRDKYINSFIKHRTRIKHDHIIELFSTGHFAKAC